MKTVPGDRRQIRIAIADDHAVLRSGLRLLLEEQPDFRVVGEAKDAAEAIALVERERPDLLLLDISMPGVSGLDAIHPVRHVSPKTDVLILTMHANEEYLFRVLSEGGAGYVLKRAADTELIDAIRRVLAGEVYVSPEIGALVARDFLDRARRGGEPSRLDDLTDREREILRLVAEGYTTQEIADRLIISPKTVETHRAHIMDKLDLHRRAELVHYALRKGILAPDA